jgi:glycosyltransferase involved in cell wall biosynthesis
MRVTFVQYGDYAEGVRRFAAGGEETYGAQKYTVDFMASLAQECEDVTVISLLAPREKVLLDDGVFFIGAKKGGGWRIPDLLRDIEDRNPTHLIVRTPLVPVIRWGVRAKIRTLPLLADSFPVVGILRLRTRLEYARLANVLNHPRIKWIADHNVPSCADLARIGVRPEKVIPYDLPPHVRPEHSPKKTAQFSSRPAKLLFVGALVIEKGVGDVLAALSKLKADGCACSLTIVGSGPAEAQLRSQTHRLGLENCVDFRGSVSHRIVTELTQDHDVAIVPSRHEYAEGMPLTLYEALAARTPLVVSDHPMFIGRFHDKQDAVVFRAGDPDSLAEAVAALLRDPALYERLSANSADTFRRLECPVKWHELITRWLRNNDDDRAWLARHALANQGQE